MSLDFSEPVLVIGVGGTGSKLASKAHKLLNCDFLQVIQQSKDIHNEGISIKISTEPVVNPSIPLIRAKTCEAKERIQEEIAKYSTVILMVNLAGKDGSAIAPIISDICAREGKKLVSFAIMPFKFEKDRIFSSGISLKRLRTDSQCTIVFDNDALLESNSELTKNQCYEISNSAILYIVESFTNAQIPYETSIISTSKKEEYETSLRDSLKMLYGSAPPGSIKRSMVYVMGGENVPIGTLNAITNISRNAFGDNKEVNFATNSSDESKIVMLSSVQGLSKFDKYDPLGIIPTENTLDWDVPETSVNFNLELPQLE